MFLEVAGPLLEAREARNNLALGICATLLAQPEVYPEARFWVLERDGRPAAAALRTPPHSLVLADPAEDTTVEEVVAAAAREDAGAPGLVANRPHAEAGARAWTQETGGTAEVTLRQAIHSLSAVEDVPRASGEARAATDADRAFLLGWFLAFAEEALPPRPGTAEQMERSLDARMRGGGSGLWIWEEAGLPVSTAGYLGKTPNGIRVGPVYTPPALRGNGYATTLVAELSRWLLAQGNRFCFLYTDLANPTSNAIYSRIGYRRVCEAVEYTFAGGRSG
jgi:predicted GNAT family acetyltransferase